MDKLDIQIRPPKASDLNFLQATFLKSMKRESNIGRSCTTRVFFSEFPKVVDQLLSNSKIIIAALRESDDVILGYLIYEPHVAVHYAFVKSAFRRLNIAKDMIDYAFPEAKQITFTMNTNSSKKICEKYPELIFNPFINYKKGA